MVNGICRFYGCSSPEYQLNLSQPNLLLVGSFLPGAVERHYFAYLKEMDMAVSFFDPSNFYNVQNIKEKLYFRYLPEILFRRANEGLLLAIELNPPDIVWIFKGIEFFPDTLKKIKDKNIILLNYNPDHPFIRSYVSNGGKNIEECVPFFDVHFCYSRDLTSKIQTEYGIKSFWLPFGYDLSNDDYKLIQQEPEIKRVCFIGNPDENRAMVIRMIARKGYKIDIYGHNWRKYLQTDQQVRIFDQALGLDYWRTLRRYRLQLNIFRPHNVNSHNMRTFEIPACGGIQVAPYSDENQIFFEPGKEIFLYRTDEELLHHIHDILDMPDQEANQVRSQSRFRVVEDHCNYEYRAQYVAGILNSL